jgi:hypothetical protein
MRMLCVTCSPWTDPSHAMDIIREQGFKPFKVIEIRDEKGFLIEKQVLFTVMDDEDKLAAFLKFPYGSLRELKWN